MKLVKRWYRLHATMACAYRIPSQQFSVNTVTFAGDQIVSQIPRCAP